MDQRGLDPARATPGRGVVRMIGESLVEAMELARQKDSAKGDERNALGAAYGQVEEQEDEHLFHSSGWCRELWIDRGHEGGAEQITRQVKGVRDVINNLRIRAAAR